MNSDVRCTRREKGKKEQTTVNIASQHEGGKSGAPRVKKKPKKKHQNTKTPLQMESINKACQDRLGKKILVFEKWWFHLPTYNLLINSFVNVVGHQSF